MLFYLIYVSTATEPLSEIQLLDLLQQSRKNNLRLNVTGMLLYQGGQFMQMLEGDQETVLQLYEHICNDARHTDVVTLEQGALMRRNYSEWSMGFHNMDKRGDMPAYDQYIEQALMSRRFQEVTEGAFKFLVSFSKLYS